MARTTGLHAFTVQEATNYEAYTSWNYEARTLTSTSYAAEGTSTYITSTNPAKKIVIYEKPGDAVAADANETLTLKLNGDTDTGKEIVIEKGNLPFTISGLTITSLVFKSSDITGNDSFSILSFH